MATNATSYGQGSAGYIEPTNRNFGNYMSSMMLGFDTTGDPGQIGLAEGLENFFTGNQDFNREIIKQNAMNAFNAAEAEKNRAWQTEMSNTSHQREVEDMKKAGLNPYLSNASQGASTPSGGAAHGTPVSSSKSPGGWGALLSLVGSAIPAGLKAANAFRAVGMRNAARSAVQSTATALTRASNNAKRSVRVFGRLGRKPDGSERRIPI